MAPPQSAEPAESRLCTCRGRHQKRGDERPVISCRTATRDLWGRNSSPKSIDSAFSISAGCTYSCRGPTTESGEWPLFFPRAWPSACAARCRIARFGRVCDLAGARFTRLRASRSCHPVQIRFCELIMCRRDLRRLSPLRQVKLGLRPALKIFEVIFRHAIHPTDRLSSVAIRRHWSWLRVHPPRGLAATAP